MVGLVILARTFVISRVSPDGLETVDVDGGHVTVGVGTISAAEYAELTGTHTVVDVYGGVTAGLGCLSRRCHIGILNVGNLIATVIVIYTDDRSEVTAAIYEVVCIVVSNKVAAATLYEV